MLRDSGNYGALLVAHIDFKLKQFIGLRYALRLQHFRDAKIDLHEIIKCDIRLLRLNGFGAHFGTLLNE